MNKLEVATFLQPNVYNVKAFNRAKIAHGNASKIMDNIAYNEVDSVVYIKNKKNLPEEFVAGRKYSYAIECIQGTVEIEYEQEQNLALISEYDDLSDQVVYAGRGIKLNIKSGEIAIFELNEAIKYQKIDGDFIEYKIAKDGGIK